MLPLQRGLVCRLSSVGRMRCSARQSLAFTRAALLKASLALPPRTWLPPSSRLGSSQWWRPLSTTSAVGPVQEKLRKTEDEATEALCQLAQRILEDRKLAHTLAAQPAAAELINCGMGLQQAAGEAIPRHSEDVLPDPALRDAAAMPPPTLWQIRIYCMHHFIPFIGFGFFDNAIMILAGDYLDMKLGLAFGLTTMASAALGNTFSDVIGLWISGFIEAFAAWLGMPDHALTTLQTSQPLLRLLKNTSMVLGIVLGCFLGMFPLIYPTEYRLWPSRDQLETAAQALALVEIEQVTSEM